jgi:hypothetical protein
MIINETEKTYLIDSMKNLLTEYDYNYEVLALRIIVEEWARQKAPLIEAFKKHPNYVEGKFMIVYDVDYERPLDLNGITDFSDYLLRKPMTQMISTLPTPIDDRRIQEDCAYLPHQLYIFLTSLNYYSQRTISEEVAAHLAAIIPEVRVHTGEKTSRVINKICRYLGYDKHPDYNREFAKYADALNPLTVKRHTILSLNPLDYLTMSFGNSWASCHTIDKANKRRMPNSYEGQYSSGTMSYMLDPSSMVLYTVDAAYDGNEYWSQPKINRQMFHWGEDKLVQSRLYPQGNDHDGEAYRPYRELVQEIMSTIFDFPNLWTTSKGTEAASRYINSYGTHYEDYNYFSNCRLCRPKDSTNENYFTVGADPICIECGEEHDCSENINCCSGMRYCADCGCRIYNEEDEYWVGDEIYCRDCVSYCDVCDEYHRDEETYIRSEDRYVCEYCLENHYTYCDCCHEYVHNSRVRYIEEEEIDICEDCEDEVAVCEECGREFLISNMTRTEDGDYLCRRCIEEKEEVIA